MIQKHSHIAKSDNADYAGVVHRGPRNRQRANDLDLEHLGNFLKNDFESLKKFKNARKKLTFLLQFYVYVRASSAH